MKFRNAALSEGYDRLCINRNILYMSTSIVACASPSPPCRCHAIVKHFSAFSVKPPASRAAHNSFVSEVRLVLEVPITMSSTGGTMSRQTLKRTGEIAFPCAIPFSTDGVIMDLDDG
ncbi:hypothetical protein ADUPG1_006861 [Aduncisulcus paluster]|uniref:Uncharacterized protein n=1 Tax=Aduncisulcus paluster TaxID=2918883 RepID=A0ABQ5KJU7_9EUKA|nr:hypothetical protein ADUPG1_006861 [Aduncisulcus paluster]